MAILVKRRFNRRGYWYCLVGSNETIKHKDLRKCFDVPDAAKKLYLSIHDRPSDWRCKAIVFDDVLGPCLDIDGVGLIDADDFDKILKPLVGKTVYVEVEYME